MRNYRSVIVGLSASLALVACGNETADDDVRNNTSEESSIEHIASSDTNSDEDNDTNIDESAAEENNQSPNDVELALESIDSYEADVSIKASVDSGDPETLDIHVKRILTDSPQMHLKANGVDSTIHTDNQTFFYNGDEWVDITDSVEYDQLYRVTYTRAVDVFSQLEEKLSASDEDDYVIYTYEGNSEKVSNLMHSLFGVNFGAIDTSAADSNVTFKIDPVTDYIHVVSFASTGEDDEGEFSLDSNVEYSAFNEVTEIDKPNVNTD